jgi:hypothetical protein
MIIAFLPNQGQLISHRFPKDIFTAETQRSLRDWFFCFPLSRRKVKVSSPPEAVEFVCFTLRSLRLEQVQAGGDILSKS